LKILKDKVILEQVLADQFGIICYVSFQEFSRLLNLLSSDAQ